MPAFCRVNVAISSLWLSTGFGAGLAAAEGGPLEIPAQAVMATAQPTAPTATPLSLTKKVETPSGGARWYGTTELRHHVSTYYDQQGGLAKQEPSLHARLQVGAQFYEGMVDTYLTLGAFKQPRSQQVLQRRPEAAIDLNLVRTDHLTLQQYSLVQLPIKTTDAGINAEDEKDDYSESTVYTVGFMPMAKLPLISGASRLELKGGVDAWTRLYSRRQYVRSKPFDDEQDDDLHGYSLAPEGDDAPIEDFALHYEAQALSGVAFSPAQLKAFSAEATVHYQNRFDPRYKKTETGDVVYDYEPTRYSYYKLRLHYDLTDRIALTNDFYHFHGGFFAAQRSGEDRRYRNIARISCKL